MSDQTPVGKGRPTPKRRERTVRRGGPVAPPPQTRREAYKRMRAKQAEERPGRRAGLAAGDDGVLLKRDAGPVRRLVRDVVDSRRSLGALLLPLALLLVAAQLSRDALVLRIATTLWTAVVLAVLVDSVLLALRVTRTVRRDHPGETGLGRHVGYALLRATAFRRLRMPPPRVRPGDPV